jgi:hypothetical protein
VSVFLQNGCCLPTSHGHLVTCWRLRVLGLLLA